MVEMSILRHLPSAPNTPGGSLLRRPPPAGDAVPAGSGSVPAPPPPPSSSEPATMTVSPPSEKKVAKSRCLNFKSISLGSGINSVSDPNKEAIGDSEWSDDEACNVPASKKASMPSGNVLFTKGTSSLSFGNELENKLASRRAAIDQSENSIC